MSWTKTDLDLLAARGCQAPGCDHAGHGGDDPVFLHGRCHPAAPIEASYVAGSGLLVIRCRRCQKLISEIQVAEGL